MNRGYRQTILNAIFLVLTFITGVGLGWRIWAEKSTNGTTLAGSTGYKLGGHAFEIIEFEDDRDENGIVERRWLAIEYGGLRFSINLENEDGVSAQGPLKITLDSTTTKTPFGILQVIESELDERGFPAGAQSVYLPARSGDRPMVHMDFDGDGFFDLVRDPNSKDTFVIINGGSHEVVSMDDSGKFGPYSIAGPAGIRVVLFEDGAWRDQPAGE
jgi:hypothetical protein